MGHPRQTSGHKRHPPPTPTRPRKETNSHPKTNTNTNTHLHRTASLHNPAGLDHGRLHQGLVLANHLLLPHHLHHPAEILLIPTHLTLIVVDILRRTLRALLLLRTRLLGARIQIFQGLPLGRGLARRHPETMTPTGRNTRAKRVKGANGTPISIAATTTTASVSGSRPFRPNARTSYPRTYLFINQVRDLIG